MRSALLIAPIFALAACNMSAGAHEGEGGPSGGGGQRSFDLSGFQSISVAGPFDVVVTVGQPHSVRAEGDADLLDRLKIEVDGDTLRIATKKDHWSFGGKHGKATIRIAMPAIDAAAIAGSGDLKIDRVQGDRFAASIGGSGDMDIGAMQVGDAAFAVAGSGGIRAAGSAGVSSIKVAGSGEVDAERLESRNASISIAGSGDVRVRAMETAKVSIAGSGDVTVAGPAKCSVSKMGSGQVRCTG